VSGRHQVNRVDPGRDRIQPVRGDRGVLGEGALPAGVPKAVAPHRLPRCEPDRAGARGGNLADQIPADHER
jgi:hypothetical protein